MMNNLQKASCRWLCFVSFVALLGPVACISVDNKNEIEEAQKYMLSATGQRPTWTALPEKASLTIPDDKVLQLDYVTNLVLENNRALRADLEVIGQAKADLVQAGLLSNPMASFLIRFPEAGGRSMLDFGITQELADLWLIPSRKRAAQAALQQTLLSYVDRVIELLTEVKSRYFELQYLHMATDLQEQNLQILKQSLDSAEARYRAGVGNVLDVNLIRARQLEAQLALQILKTDYLTTQHNLLRLMGVSFDSVDWKTQPLALEFQVLNINEPQLIELALLQRLDALAADWQLQSAVANLEQQRLRVISSLGIGVSAERSEMRAQPGRKILADTARASIANGGLTAPEIQSKAERRRERDQQIDWTIGPAMQFPMPIFDQNQAQIAKAQFKARELKERYEEVQQRIVENVRSTLAQRKLAEYRAQYYRDLLLPLQESNLQIAQQVYRAGQESILTVLLAQESLISTRLEYAVAIRDLVIKTAELERQISSKIPEGLLLGPVEPNKAPETQPTTEESTSLQPDNLKPRDIP